VGHVGADEALGGLHPLLELGKELVDEPGPADGGGGQLTGVALGDPQGHGVGRAAGQLAGVSIGTGQVECFKDLHDLLGRLHVLLLGGEGA